MNRFLIYTLSDPATGAVRYVGRSSNGLKRPKSHWQDPRLRDRKDHCHNWVRQILAAGAVPEISVVVSWESADNNEINAAEIATIAKFKAEGCALTNATVGGEGASGCRRSAETRMKIAKSRVGKTNGPFSEEHKHRISAALKNRQPSPQCREAARQARLGKPSATRVAVRRNDGVVFSSMTEAAKSIGATPGMIHEVLSGKLKQAKGFTFERVS